MSKIGIVGWKTGENSFGVTVPYLEFFSSYGAVQILTPNESIQDLDLLVLPGGLDVDPNRFGKAPSFFTSNPNVFLEYFDKNVLPKYIEKRTPIFGICRGLQTLNVYFGGTLANCYQETSTKSRDELVHDLYIGNEFPVGKNKGNTIKVNSLHHQAIDQLGSHLHTLAIHENGDIEAIGGNDYPMYAVQYHPEEIYDKLSNAMIKKLLNYE